MCRLVDRLACQVAVGCVDQVNRNAVRFRSDSQQTVIGHRRRWFQGSRVRAVPLLFIKTRSLGVNVADMPHSVDKGRIRAGR
jgi:hypothetical protein